MMKNNWKKAFLILLGINLLIVVVGLSLLFVPSLGKREIQPNVPNRDYVPFYIKSNKKDLNLLINHYLQQEAAGSPMAYRVALTNEVEFYGSLPVLTELINLKLTFEPEALPNGDLVLKQKSISLGSLRLPVSYVLKFISENYKLPNGVDIRPNEKLIYINMQQLKLKSGVKVKVNKFHLKEDDIAFTLLVPVK